MSATVTSLLSLPVRLAAEGRIKATKGATTSRASIASGTWLRHYLAAAGAAGTSHLVPKEAGATLQTALNAATGMSGWVVRMRSDARWEVTNTLSTWALVMDGSDVDSNYILRDLFGFASNVPSTPAGTYVASDWNPYGVVASISRSDGSGWGPEAPLAAGATMDDGSSYVFMSPMVRVTRTFDLQFHPYRLADRATGSFPHTPFAHHPDYWRATAGQGIGSGRTMPFSLWEFLMLAPGRRLGLALSPTGFDAQVRGDTTTYDTGDLDLESLKREMARQSAPNLASLRHVTGLKFSFTGTAVRS